MSGNANSGRRKDKPFRDALMLALNRIQATKDGTEQKKLDGLAESLVKEGLGGNVPALKEIADRVDGKVPQGVIGGDEDDNPVNILHRIESLIVDPANPSS